MRIDADTAIWVVCDPTPDSTLPDICFETTLAGLRLQFAGGLTIEEHPTIFTTQDEAHEDAKNRLLVWKVANRIREERRLPADEVVRITLHDADGQVVWKGDVR